MFKFLWIATELSRQCTLTGDGGVGVGVAGSLYHLGGAVVWVVRVIEDVKMEHRKVSYGNTNTSLCLKSLRSVQIYILNQKITPEVLRFDQYCEKSLGMLATKSFFSVTFGVAALSSLLPYR